MSLSFQGLKDHINFQTKPCAQLQGFCPVITRQGHLSKYRYENISPVDHLPDWKETFWSFVCTSEHTNLHGSQKGREVKRSLPSSLQSDRGKKRNLRRWKRKQWEVSNLMGWLWATRKPLKESVWHLLEEKDPDEQPEPVVDVNTDTKERILFNMYKYHKPRKKKILSNMYEYQKMAFKQRSFTLKDPSVGTIKDGNDTFN